VPQEIELKLRIKENCDNVLDELKRIFNAKAFSSEQLLNSYYDTPAFDLNHKKVALRIRQQGGQYIQTLKTKGKSKKGVHQRGEWEWLLDQKRLDEKALLDCDVWPADVERAALEPVFETDFVRHVAVIRWEESTIELAYDQGWIVVAEQSEPIQEIELELISGEASILHEIGSYIQRSLPVEPYDVSKAERGYRLFAAVHRP